MKKKRNDNDYFEYTKEGEIKIMKLQCEDCKNQLEDLYVCKKYTDRKPLGVLRCEIECPDFEQK